MKNIFFLPTDQPSKLGYHFDILSSGSIDYAPNFGFDEFNTKNNYQHRPYHLYITSDEEINLGDWLIWRNNVLCDSNRSFTGVDYSECKKILLTTDKKLIADGIQAIDDEFLEWFVKNPSCEYVKTELLNVSEVLWEEYFKKHGVYPKYPYYEKIIIPQGEPKTNLEKLPFPKLVEEFANYYKKVPLVEEPKQERLEDAIYKIFKSKEYSNVDLNPNAYGFMLAGAQEGAKWQTERMYSGEEVLKIINKFNEIHYHPSEECEITEWFEQFKKK
jgi:hypothetical protein